MRGQDPSYDGDGTRKMRPEMRNCSSVGSVQNTASTLLAFGETCVTFGVRMSVVLMRRGRDGYEEGVTNERRICERTRGVLDGWSYVASWKTPFMLPFCFTLSSASTRAGYQCLPGSIGAVMD